MATIAPAAPVVGATRIPVPYGLFSVAAFRGDGDRWESGVQWEALTPDALEWIGQWQVPPTTTTGLPKDLAKNIGPLGEASPFTVYGHFNCSPVGWSPAEAQEQATAQLLAYEETRAEQALWTGHLGNTPNLSVGAEDLAPGASVGAAVALGMLEEFIADSYGSLGVIHMSKRGAGAVAALNMVEARGNRLTTRLGTPVVAGSGYPNTGPDGLEPSENEKSWMRASPAIFGYRSEVFTSSNTAGDLLDRGLNNLYAIAERSYLLGFDPTGVGAVLVELA